MADYSELVQAFRWVIEQRVQKKFVFTRGLIGDGQGNVDVTDRPNFSYVRPDRGRADYVEMFNKLANTAVDGTPILIGNIPWQPNLTQVLGVDWEAFMSVGWNVSFGGLAAHGQSHAWLDGREPEADYFDIHFRQILPLRTYPLGSGTPSVLVTTWGTEYSGTFVTWPGEPGLSLANAVPPSTGIMREMLVFWDVGLNQLSAMTGTLSYSVTAAPPRPVLATTGSFIPSGYVRLQGGQQSIANTDIFDARQFLSSSSLVSTVTSTGTTSFWQQAVDTDTLIPVSAEKVRLGLAVQADTNIADHWLEIITTGTPSQATVHYDTATSIGNISNVYRAKGTQASPAAVADNDVIFKETYYGYAATGVTWFSVAQMRVEIDGIPIGDDIPGSIVFDAHTPGDAGGGLTERLRIAPTGVIVNAQQEEIDFRVAGSLGDDNVFFVSGLTEKSGFGTANPDGTVHIHTATAGTVTASAPADELVLENSGSAGMHILSPDINLSSIYMGSPSQSVGASIDWLYGSAGAVQKMQIGTNSATGQVSIVSGIAVEAMQINASQNILISNDLVHLSDTDTKIAFTPDVITFTAGNEVLLTLTKAAQDVVKIGDGGDVDIDLNGDIFIRGSDGFVGLGAGFQSPDKLFHVKTTVAATPFRVEGSGAFVGMEFKNDTATPLLFFDFIDGANAILTRFSHLTGNGEIQVRETNGDFNIRTDDGSGLSIKMTLQDTGRLGIGIVGPLAKIHVDQSSTTAAIPVAYFDQADVSEEMFEFATTIGVGNAIEAVGAKTLTTTHFIKVTIPGGLTRYFPVGTIA